MLRSSWLTLTFLFEDPSWDEAIGADHEASRSWSGASFLGKAKEEEGVCSFLVNSGEEDQVDVKL